jgi:lysophospholipase L1-like esterase
VLYATLIVLGFFGCVEVVLWWIDPAPTVRKRLILRAMDVDIEFPFMAPDDELFWSPRPGFTGVFRGESVRINSLGLRGRELRIPKPPGRRRLLTFGDSITFGYGVGDDDTYPAVLGHALAERGMEVANAGVTGYTSFQVLGRLRALAPVVTADVATFCIGWNDGTLRPVEDRVYAARIRSTQTLTGTLNGWRLYRFLAGSYVRHQLRAEKEARVRESARVPLDQYRRNLEQIVDEARRAAITPVFLRFPRRRLPGESTSENPYEAVLLEVGRDREVPTIPLESLGLESEMDDTGELFIDSLHFSRKGNAAMAELIARYLIHSGVA